MTFFTDENFIYQAAKLLEAFDRDHKVRALVDHFDKGTADTVWIPEIGKWDPKPFVISGDGRILTNKVELSALRSSGLTFFCLSSGWTHTGWNTYAWKIIKVWPAIVEDAKHNLRPAVYEVSPSTLKVTRRLNL